MERRRRVCVVRGPLAPWASGFEGWLVARGYRPSAVFHRSCLLGVLSLVVLCYVADFACHDIRRRIPSLPRTHDAPDRGSMDFDPDSGYLTKHY